LRAIAGSIAEFTQIASISVEGVAATIDIRKCSLFLRGFGLPERRFWLGASFPFTAGSGVFTPRMSRVHRCSHLGGPVKDLGL
jgi:hypothetical protein